MALVIVYPAVTKSLVIAEKPSVAQDMARALGAKKAATGIFENDDYVITFAIGHLLELDDEANGAAKKKAGKAGAAKKAAKPKKWSLDSLPCIPNLTLRPLKDGKTHLDRIKRQWRRDDVGTVINACDAGREGELIFSNIRHYLTVQSSSKAPDRPVKRLWLQSMTQGAIRDAFSSLRENAELDPLRSAAVARSRADWLVGINATRAFTAINSKDGGFVLTPAGRVQTPTLALLVMREKERQKHKPADYWQIKARFSIAAGGYDARWVGKGDDGKDSDRIFDREKAERVMAQLDVSGKLATDFVRDGLSNEDTKVLLDAASANGIATDESKEKTLNSPALFDLNTLQREANRAHSFTARTTLRAAQALYQKHKLVTYPRTETRHLPEDYKSECESALRRVGGFSSHLASEGNVSQATGGVRTVGKKVFDDSKLTDHFAIIPTGEDPSKHTLSEIERKVFDMVCRRFVAAFMPAAKVRETVRTTTVGKERFRSKGRVVLSAGWLEVDGNAKDADLPALEGDSESARIVGSEMQQKQTQPPARYNDAKLIAAMQGAYRFIKDEEDLAEALKEGGGLGTPATRAEIIEELIRNHYVNRDRGELVPSQRAFSLLDMCRGMEIDVLTTPSLTGEWESRLKKIENGGDAGHSELSERFLEDIRDLVRKIAGIAKTFNLDEMEGDYKVLEARCPKDGCGGEIAEGPRRFECRKCGFFFWKTVARREMTVSDAEQLVKDGKSDQFEDFISKFGKPFTATMVLDKETGKIDLEFPSDGGAMDDGDVKVVSEDPVAPCPKDGCGGKVIEVEVDEEEGPERFYCCGNRLAKGEDGKPKCGFRLRKVVCKRALSREEANKLVEDKKTDLIEDFTSKRGRPFSAYLTLDESGKMGFEFLPREKKKPAAKKSAAKKAA